MKAAMSVMNMLLYFLPALLEVQSQRVPYITFMGNNLPNNSYIDLTLVEDYGYAYESDLDIWCHTDLITCCSKTHGPNCGDWYFPSGAKLPFSQHTFGLFQSRQAKKVGLFFRNLAQIYEGIYRCDIETNAVHNDSRETVYAGLYTSEGKYNCM